MSLRRPPEPPNLGHRQPPENSLQHCGASGFTMGPPRRDGPHARTACTTARPPIRRKSSLHHRQATGNHRKTACTTAGPPIRRKSSLHHRQATGIHWKTACNTAGPPAKRSKQGCAPLKQLFFLIPLSVFSLGKVSGLGRGPWWSFLGGRF